MSIINYITTYLICGIIFSFLLETYNNALSEQEEGKDLKVELTWGARFFLCTLWPFYLLLFIFTFLKSSNNRK